MSRSFIVLDVEQRSPEWLLARLGRLTGSRAADMLATGRSGGEAATRRNYRMQLVLERLTGVSHESGYVSAAIQQGIEREPEALEQYEVVTGNLVTRTGFIQHTALMVGCSLDGHIGNFEGLVEAKSPLAATHYEYLRSGEVPAEYVKQITHAFWVTGATWCDWLSFNPDFPAPLQTKIVRLARDEVAIADYDKKARAFLAEVERDMQALRTMADLEGTLTSAVGAR